MAELSRRLKAIGVTWDPKDNRLGCFAHIINLCAQAAITAFSGGSLDDDNEDGFDPADNVDFPEGMVGATLTRNPLALARKIIRSIRASEQRYEQYLMVIREGNAKSWKFGTAHAASGDNVEEEEEIVLPELALLLDMRVRWDSTYQMLQRFRQMRPVSQPTSPILGSALISFVNRLWITTSRWRRSRETLSWGS